MDKLSKYPENLRELIHFYVSKTKLHYQDFAKEIPVSRSYLHVILNERKAPSKKMDMKIRRHIIDRLVERQKNS